MACASIFYKNKTDDTQSGKKQIQVTVETESNVHTDEHTYLYNIIIKQQPEVVAFHDGDVVTPVWTTEKTQQTE